MVEVEDVKQVVALDNTQIDNQSVLPVQDNQTHISQLL